MTALQEYNQETAKIDEVIFKKIITLLLRRPLYVSLYSLPVKVSWNIGVEIP